MNWQIVKCDVCGRSYKQFGDAHEIGEQNYCCEHCLWTVSNCGEKQPKHTCIEEKEKVIFT